MEPDSVYYRRRLDDELRAAQHSSSIAAEERHRQMAILYAAKLRQYGERVSVAA